MDKVDKEFSNHRNIINKKLRVKVFIYFADQWREKGIGYVSINKIDDDNEKSFQLYKDYYIKIPNKSYNNEKMNNKGIDNQSKDDIYDKILPVYRLVIRSQVDQHDQLISTYITNNMDYYIQEGSILTWKEGDYEKAISFESANDCNQFMEIVKGIQHEISELLSTSKNIISNTNYIDNKTIHDIVDTTNINDQYKLKLTSNDDDDDVDGISEYNNNITNNDCQLINKSINDTLFTDGDKVANEDESEMEYTIDDNSVSVTDDFSSSNFPDVSVDTLDSWIQLITYPNMNMSCSNHHLIGNNDSTSLLISKVVSTSISDDINNLYRYMSENNIVKQFIDMFEYFEDDEHYELDILFRLHKIFKGFIATDNLDIFRLLFEESLSTTLNVIGILEYDPTLETRIHHRDYLKNKAKFRKFFLLDASITNELPTPISSSSSSSITTVIDDNNQDEMTKSNNIVTENETSINSLTKYSTLENICEKATLIYYIQYIIDHIMPTPSIFDDKLGPLTSYLNHHKADLCNLIYDNTVLLNNLFVFLTHGNLNQDNNSIQISTAHHNGDNIKNCDTKFDSMKYNNSINFVEGQLKFIATIDDYVDSVSFLHEFCLLSNSLNLSDKEFFFNWLESYNLLDVLCKLLKQINPKIRLKVIDIIALLIDYKVASIRTFITNQIDKATKNNTTTTNDNISLMDDLIATIIEYSHDPISLQCINIINLLMDYDLVNSTDASYFEKMNSFYDNFFTYSFKNFIKPFKNLIHNGVFHSDIDTGHNAILFDRLLSLLTRWSGYHHDLFVTSILSNNIIYYITQLLESSHKFVICGVVRLIRKLIEFKDTSIDNELIKHETISKITDLFVNTCLNCNNLLNNTIVEMFDFILIDDLHIYYLPLVDKHRNIFLSINYIDTFKRIVARHDATMNKSSGGVSLSFDSTCSNTTTNTPTEIYSSARKRKSCDFETSEEKWFNSNDDDDTNNEKDYSNNNNNSLSNDSTATLYIDDNNVRHTAKKRKNSPMKVDIFDELLCNDNQSYVGSSNTHNNRVDDETLFDMLVGNLQINSHYKNNCDNDDDVLDNLSESKLSHIDIPKKTSQRNSFIKIHTNKLNSSRNLVMAASQSDTSSSSFHSNLNTSYSSDHDSTVIVDDPVLSDNRDSTKGNNETSLNISFFHNNSLDYSHCIVETTYEDDSDKSLVNDDTNNK